MACPWLAPSHYLNQCWNIVNCTLMNKLQWNFNRNSNIFTEENAFENVFCKMTSIFLDVSVFKLIGPVRPRGVTDLGQLSFTSWRPYCDVATLSALLPFLSPVVPRTKADEAVLRRFLWNTRWRHQVETFSALLALCVGNSPMTGEFPSQRPVTQSFDVFFDLCLNKRMSKHFFKLVIWDAIALIMPSR